MTILFDLFNKYWREFVIIVLCASIYAMIYQRGYESCEEKVRLATEKATAEQVVKAAIAQRSLNDAANLLNKQIMQEKLRNRDTEGKLNAIIHSKNYTDCKLSADGLHLYNGLSK